MRKHIDLTKPANSSKLRNKILARRFQATRKNFFLCVIFFTLILGIFLRFVNIDTKLYWTDEAFTSLQVSGYLQEEVREALLTGNPVDYQSLKTFQYPTSSDKYFTDTIKGIISFEPQHTPGYFLVARAWLKLTGNSIYNIRILSVFFSLFSIVAAYFFCLEFLGSHKYGVCGAAVLASSPFHLLYAHEARPFGMWILLTLVSCLFFQKAKNNGKSINWFFYALSLSLSLYTFLFSFFTIIAHSAYVLLTRGRYIKGKVIYFCWAVLSAIISFIPWILVLANNPVENYATRGNFAIYYHLKAWVRHISLLFVDFNLNEESWPPMVLLFSLFVIFLILFLSYLIVCCLRNLSQDDAIFLSTLLTIPFLIPLLYDVLKGGLLTARDAYLIPSLISLQIIFIWGLGRVLIVSSRRKSGFALLFSGLLAVSLFSCAYMVSSEDWWLKDGNNGRLIINAAETINQEDSPLIISDSFFISVFTLSHCLKEDSHYLLFPEPEARDIRDYNLELPDEFSTFFAYMPSEQLLEELNKKFEILQEVKNDVLWRIVPVKGVTV